MTANGDDLHQLLQDIGIVVAVGVGIGGGVAAFFRRLRKKKLALVERGKEIQAKEDEIKDIKGKISNIELTLQKLEKRVDDNDAAIHCLKEEIPQAVGQVRESLARLDEAIKHIPNNKKK